LEKLLALGMPREVLSKTLQASVSQRLVRRLCPKCAEEYKPAPEILARLKLPAVESLTFKRAIAEGCPACSGTGHLGRTGIYELAGGPTVSKAIAAKVDRATMLKAAVRDGMQRLPEAGIAAVVERVVGLDEIQRIFKKG
jgi:type II secretory ATPase GspE/PulE/Tfp pilus assembly ATPase PilB-like protein